MTTRPCLKVYTTLASSKLLPYVFVLKLLLRVSRLAEWKISRSEGTSYLKQNYFTKLELLGICLTGALVRGFIRTISVLIR